MPLSSAVVQTLRVRPQLQSAVRDAMSRVVSPSGTEPNSPPAPEEVLLSCYRTKTEQLGSSSSVQPHMSASAYRSSPVEYIPAPKPSLTPSSKPRSKETRVKGRSNLAEEQRRLNLESDRFAKIISPILVECIGCGRHVKLDARGTYYTQFWYKHRDGCEAIPKEDRIVHLHLRRKEVSVLSDRSETTLRDLKKSYKKAHGSLQKVRETKAQMSAK